MNRSEFDGPILKAMYEREGENPEIAATRSRCARLMSKMANIPPASLGMMMRVSEKAAMYQTKELSVFCPLCHHSGVLDCEKLWEKKQDEIVVGCSQCGNLIQRIHYY